MVRTPGLLLLPLGGRFTYKRRPDQRMRVATPMKMPGTPKAQPAPARCNSIGLLSVASRLPKLIIQ